MANVTASTPIELVEEVYASLPDRVSLGHDRLGRPLTLCDGEVIRGILN